MRSARRQPPPVAAAGAVDEEPLRLAAAALRRAAAGSDRPSPTALAGFAIFCVLSGVVYLINDVADRDADRLHPVKMRRPIASGAVLDRRGRWPRRPRSAPSRSARRSGCASPFGILAAAYLGAAGALFGTAEAHRHHRRADDCRRLRAPRRRRRGRDQRAHQPLALRADHPAGAVPGAQQAAARAGAPGGRRHRTPARSSRNTARTCSTR